LEFLEAWNTIFFTEFKDYDDAIEKLSGKRHIASFVFMFYEEVGVLLRKKLIDTGLVEELLGTSAKQIWEKSQGFNRRCQKEVFARGIFAF